MNKLKAVVQYECTTSLKHIWLFCGIMLIIGIGTGRFEDINTSNLEVNSMIYVGVLGALGFEQDFKMLIQNGFTRKMIFSATLFMFCFVSGIMAFIDTIIANLIHHVDNDYVSLYSGIYGYDNIFMNWLWLFLVYVLVFCLLYLAVLVINKVGKFVSISLGVFLVGCVLLVIALFRYVFSAEAARNILEFLTKAMGFMTDGTINYFFPVLTFLILDGILGSVSFMIIQRTELK